MDVITTLSTLEKILSIAGPLASALLANDQKKAADAALHAAETAIGYARAGLTGATQFAQELQDIADDLQKLRNSGGIHEEDFDALADSIRDKTEKLKQVAAART